MNRELHRRSAAEKNEVIEQIARAMDRQGEIRFAYVFGSFIEDTPFHDVDVGVFLASTDPASALRVAAGTASCLEQTLHLPIDVCVLNFAPLPFLHHVIRGQLIFERDEDLRAEIVERTVREYLDIKPVLLRSTREAFAA